MMDIFSLVSQHMYDLLGSNYNLFFWQFPYFLRYCCWIIFGTYPMLGFNTIASPPCDDFWTINNTNYLGIVENSDDHDLEWINQIPAIRGINNLICLFFWCKISEPSAVWIHQCKIKMWYSFSAKLGLFAFCREKGRDEIVLPRSGELNEKVWHSYNPNTNLITPWTIDAMPLEMFGIRISFAYGKFRCQCWVPRCIACRIYTRKSGILLKYPPSRISRIFCIPWDDWLGKPSVKCRVYHFIWEYPTCGHLVCATTLDISNRFMSIDLFLYVYRDYLTLVFES